MTRKGSSCRKYKIIPGLRVPRQTRFNQINKLKASKIHNKIGNITSGPVINSQGLAFSSQIESLNETNEVIEFESLLCNNELIVGEEPQEQQQEMENELLEIIEEKYHSKLHKPEKLEISCALLAIFLVD